MDEELEYGESVFDRNEINASDYLFRRNLSYQIDWQFGFVIMNKKTADLSEFDMKYPNCSTYDHSDDII